MYYARIRATIDDMIEEGLTLLRESQDLSKWLDKAFQILCKFSRDEKNTIRHFARNVSAAPNDARAFASAKGMLENLRWELEERERGNV